MLYLKTSIHYLNMWICLIFMDLLCFHFKRLQAMLEYMVWHSHIDFVTEYVIFVCNKSYFFLENDTLFLVLFLVSIKILFSFGLGSSFELSTVESDSRQTKERIKAQPPSPKVANVYNHEKPLWSGANFSRKVRSSESVYLRTVEPPPRFREWPPRNRSSFAALEPRRRCDVSLELLQPQVKYAGKWSA